MTKQFNPQGIFMIKKGFTLIELLVVVLIIGILAAIAMPQYTRSVERSKGAEAEIIMSALVRATQAYLMESGETNPIFNVSDLSIGIPGTMTVNSNGQEVFRTDNFQFRASLSHSGGVANAGSPYVFGYRKKGTATQYILMRAASTTPSVCNPACCWYVAAAETTCTALGYNVVNPTTGCSSSSLGCRTKG